MSPLVTVADFIAFFEAIPEERWCVGTDAPNGVTCALGHCPGFTWMTLGNLLCNDTEAINDGLHPAYQQPTPRARILAALRDKL